MGNSVREKRNLGNTKRDIAVPVQVIRCADLIRTVQYPSSHEIAQYGGRVMLQHTASEKFVTVEKKHSEPGKYLQMSVKRGPANESSFFNVETVFKVGIALK